MRVKIFAFLSLLLCAGMAFAQNSDDWYQGKPIQDVTFTGLRSVAESELDGIFTVYRGKNFSDEIYSEILQKIYSLEYFDDISPLAVPGDADRKTVILQFTVKERPVLSDIKFSGNRAFRAGELLDKVTLKKGDIYNELKSRMDERAIRDFYLEKGYAGVKVASEAVANNDKSITLKFTIAEGKQTVISSINFEGNKVIASKTLKKALSLKESRFLQSGTFREAQLETDKAALRSYYLERGYIDADVANVVREVDSSSDKDKNLLKLTFVISEGEQYTYGGTEISGNSIFTTEELLGKINLKVGDVMNQNRFDEGFQAVADTYFESGYTSNYINKEAIRDAEHRQVSYKITVVESERSHIEHIIVRGNTKTKEDVILREFTMEPGDIFSKGKMMTSMRNLYNLRYFSSVAPDLVPGSEDNLVDVIVNVEEQNTASVNFGVTYSGSTDADTFPLSVFTSWQDTNFQGTGRTLSANVTASPDTQSVTLGFSENYFLGSPLTVSYNFAISHKVLYAYRDDMGTIFDDDFYDENGMVPDPYETLAEYEDASSVSSAYRMQYDHWSIGTGASTGYRWNPIFAAFTLRGGINFSVVQNMYDDTIYRPADKEIRDEHGSWKLNNSIWTRASLDDRDLAYDPSKGWFASQQMTIYGIFPNIETAYYQKFDTKLEGYLTLLDIPLTDLFRLKFVLAGFTNFTFLTTLNDETISDSNKLYVDGMFVGRGWTDLYDDSSAKGDMLLSHSVELRSPLAVGIIAADFFFDAVAPLKEKSDLLNLSLNDYYFSYGPGLRFSIPQFPLRLLFANTFRIQDGKYEPESNWAFVLSFNISNN